MVPLLRRCRRRGAELTRVLVVGAAGYLGSRLAAEWSQRPDVSVRALVRTDRGYPPADERVKLDVLEASPAALADACADVDTVVHLATPNEVIFAADTERSLVDAVVVTHRLMAAAAAAGARRLVYVSTVHVYGEAMAPGKTVDEATLPAPLAPYAIARLASELLTSAAAGPEGQGPEVVVLRVTNVVGAPGHPSVERWSLLANDLCRQVVTTGRMVLRTHGMQWRDFLAMTDATRILGAFLEPGGLPPGTFNVGRGEPLTCRGLAELVQDAAEACTGRRPVIEAPDPPPQPPDPTFVAVDRLAGVGLQAACPMSEAVEETMRFCLDHRSEL